MRQRERERENFAEKGSRTLFFVFFSFDFLFAFKKVGRGSSTIRRIGNGVEAWVFDLIEFLRSHSLDPSIGSKGEK